MKSKILYISYTGMMEPLGTSQVLNYLQGLSHHFTFYLISLEKPEDFNDNQKREDLDKELLTYNISWLPMEYGLGAKNYVFNFFKMYSLSKKIIQQKQIKLIHCRSYMPALVAFLIKKFNKRVYYIFDTRGFWFDEKADVGSWSRKRFVFKLAKSLEKNLYTNAAAIVMLSKKSKELIQTNQLFKGGDKLKNIHFIPTCTDLKKFTPDYSSRTNKIKIGYIGNAGSWYDFDKTAELLVLLKKEIDYDLYIYNGGQHQLIRDCLSKHNFTDNYILSRIAFEDIPEKMRALDLSVFFIRPYFSKNASAATKLGELMASGVPVLTNANVGDHEYLINSYGAGKVLDIEKLECYNYSLIMDELVTTTSKEKCRNLAEEVFSLENGVENYKNIYLAILS